MNLEQYFKNNDWEIGVFEGIREKGNQCVMIDNDDLMLNVEMNTKSIEESITLLENIKLELNRE